VRLRSWLCLQGLLALRLKQSKTALDRPRRSASEGHFAACFLLQWPLDRLRNFERVTKKDSMISSVESIIWAKQIGTYPLNAFTPLQLQKQRQPTVHSITKFGIHCHTVDQHVVYLCNSWIIFLAAGIQEKWG
jgi:hypothetical protein